MTLSKLVKDEDSDSDSDSETEDEDNEPRKLKRAGQKRQSRSTFQKFKNLFHSKVYNTYQELIYSLRHLILAVGAEEFSLIPSMETSTTAHAPSAICLQNLRKFTSRTETNGERTWSSAYIWHHRRNGCKNRVICDGYN